MTSPNTSVLPISDLWHIPAAMPPDGVTPNFVNPPSLAPLPRIGLFVFVPMMLIFFILRFYTRVYLTRSLGWDDFFCIVAAATIITFSGLLLRILDNPLGRHMWDIPVAALTDRFMQFTILIFILYTLSAMFVRVTLLVLYLRLFNPVTWALWLIWLGIALVVPFYLTCMIVLLSICVPRAGQTWIDMTAHGSCTSTQLQISLSQGYFGLFSDLYILAIPLWLVSLLSLAPKRKAAVMAVFLTGLLACGCSAAGLANRHGLEADDATWTDSLTYIFGIAETNIGLICSCLPVVSMPLKTMMTQMILSWHSIKKYSSTLLSKTDDTGKSKEQLPQVPSATISGLRTFIRRVGRVHTRSAGMDEMSTFTVLNSIDRDYHEELRAIHHIDLERDAPSSRAQAPDTQKLTQH